MNTISVPTFFGTDITMNGGAVIDLGANRARNADDPVDPTDLATKEYVDAAVGAATHFRTSTLVADTAFITPNLAYDMTIQNNTQAAGNLTVNAPVGIPVEGQGVLLRIKTLHPQTFVFDPVYRQSTYLLLPLLTVSGKTIYLGFARNNTDSKYDLTTVMRDY